MRKKIRLLTFLFFILTCVFAFLLFKNYEKDSKEFDIILKMNAGTPYNWNYEIENENIIKNVDKVIVNRANENVVGGPIDVHFKFEALKMGKTTITFKFENITNNKVEETKTYDIIVGNKLNVYVNERK